MAIHCNWSRNRTALRSPARKSYSLSLDRQTVASPNCSMMTIRAHRFECCTWLCTHQTVYRFVCQHRRVRTVKFIRQCDIYMCTMCFRRMGIRICRYAKPWAQRCYRDVAQAQRFRSSVTHGEVGIIIKLLTFINTI